MTRKTIDGLQKLLGTALETNSQVHENLANIVAHCVKNHQALKSACDEEVAKIKDEADRRIEETRRHYADLQRVEKERQDQIVALLNRFDAPEPDKKAAPDQQKQGDTVATIPVKAAKAA
ncbi:MAG: hypothetical protein AB7I42_26450 [Bradyrhizobium sp.]|uniref:hypothetical protein n=1 Tax=Bradyrhizobium sp. TaxID=376 RepID=UPI003D0AE2A4